MNYAEEKYDEVRAAIRYSVSNATIDRILSIFATVPQVTEEELNHALVGSRFTMLDAINSVLAKQGPVIAAYGVPRKGGAVMADERISEARLRDIAQDTTTAITTGYPVVQALAGEILILRKSIERAEQENAALKARTLSCVFCGEPAVSVDALKVHSALCLSHPAVQVAAVLKKQVDDNMATTIRGAGCTNLGRYKGDES